MESGDSLDFCRIACSAGRCQRVQQEAGESPGEFRDTNALIDLSRRLGSPNRRRASALIGQLIAQGQTPCTSRLNEAEFRIGAFRAADPVQEAAKINSIVVTLVVLAFDATAAERCAQVQAQLLAAGRPAGRLT